MLSKHWELKQGHESIQKIDLTESKKSK